MVVSKNENITDFYVEANIDGNHKGVFKSETQANWHRKHKQHHSSHYNDHTQSKENFLNRKVFSNQFFTTTTTDSYIAGIKTESSVTHPVKKIRVDESGILISNGNDEQTSSVILTPTNSSAMRRSKRLKMSNHMVDHCTQEYWNENVIAGSRTLQFTKRWLYTKTDLKNKTVSFRFVFAHNFLHVLFCFATVVVVVFFLIITFLWYFLTLIFNLHISRILFRKRFSFDVFELTENFIRKDGKAL